MPDWSFYGRTEALLEINSRGVRKHAGCWYPSRWPLRDLPGMVFETRGANVATRNLESAGVNAAPQR